MAEFANQVTVSGFKAAADLSGKQYTFVRMSAAGTVNLASEVAVSAANKVAFGVLQNKPKTNEAATVAVLGETKVLAGAAAAVDKLITYNSSGKAVEAASGDMVCGRFLEAANNDGDFVSAFLHQPIRWASVS